MTVPRTKPPGWQPPRPKAKRGWTRWLGAIVLAAVALAIFYGAIIYKGLQEGNVLRASYIQATLEANLDRQMELAEQDFSAGNYDRALQRLSYVLDSPSEAAAQYAGRAQQLKSMAEERQTLQLTPSPTATPPLPTATPTITPTPEPIEAINRLNELVEEERWEEAIEGLVRFQSTNPNYHRQETNQLLFDAYVNYGVELLYGEQVEQGIFYLEQAEKLGTLPQDAQDQRSWAEFYLKGIAFYGVNWGISISYFNDLCLSAPFYQDACDLLFEARVAYGDQFANAQDYCPAERYYTDAWRQLGGNEVNQKRLEANRECRQATPTPTMTLTPAAQPQTTPTP